MAFPELQRGRWREAVVRAFADNDGDIGMPGELRSMVGALRLEPDAFEIIAEPRELVFFEVEVYNPMSDDKLRSFAKLAIDLDSHGVAFSVQVVNKHGHINEVDLRWHYAGLLRRDREARSEPEPSAASRRVNEQWVAQVRALQA